MTYTALAFVAAAAAGVLDLFILRTRLVLRQIFWVTYAIVVAFQLGMNGLLSCRKVVTYHRDAILGLKIACAPVEDLLFGFSLVVQTLAWWVWWGRRLGARGPARRRHDRVS